MRVEQLIEHIETKLSRPGILSELADIIASGASTAGKRPEEVFTREFLCPLIADFFYNNYRDIKLSDKEISDGLGTEGYKKAEGFGFRPARELPHLFTKSEIVKSKVPDSWNKSENPTGKQACPDFAIRKPLPLSIVGDVKFFKSESPQAAVKTLYDAAREMVFYLGVYGREYDDALIVVADASPSHAFDQGMKLIHRDILSRFGAQSRIYLAVARLS